MQRYVGLFSVQLCSVYCSQKFVARGCWSICKSMWKSNTHLKFEGNLRHWGRREGVRERVGKMGEGSERIRRKS